MKIALTGGAYEARSVVASAQRCVNLYPEPVPQQQGEPMPVSHYPTPGLRLLATIGTGPIRGIRQASTGQTYVVSGDNVWYVDARWTPTLLGSLTPGLTTPVSMADNSLVMVIVDGSANGWQITLDGTNTFSQIPNPDGIFYGADRVDYLDTFFVFNQPNTQQFYWSDSLATTFDPTVLSAAGKVSNSDLLRTLIVAKRDVWLIGDKTTEIWADVGLNSDGTGSQFASQSEIIIDHGTVAKYSVASYDNSAFWLSADRAGHGIVLEGAGYSAKRVSTYAIETAIAGYATISDAIGFCYQMMGHAFYVLTFPAANKTWVYDIGTQLWHEWVWIDVNGAEHRHRANCYWPGRWRAGRGRLAERECLRARPDRVHRQRRTDHPHSLVSAYRGQWAPGVLPSTCGGHGNRHVAQSGRVAGTGQFDLAVVVR